MDTRSGNNSEVNLSSGQPGVPLPLSRDQHSRKVDKFTLKFSGTTFVDSASDGTNVNLWGNFPWEYMQLFTGDETAYELSQKYLYWKAVGIDMEFKNPVCIQNIGTTASGLQSSGQNDHAQLYVYRDDCYLCGVGNGPTPENITPLSAASINDLQRSWHNNGLSNGTATSLQNLDFGQWRFDSASPDVKAMGMGAGQGIKVGWNIHCPYWRGTGEFLNSRPFSSLSGGYDSACFSRWDESLGIVGLINKRGAGPGVSIKEVSLHQALDRGQVPGRNWWSYPVLPAQMNGIADQTFRSPDPIPKLFLQLQPQLASLEAGVGQSKAQVQWEMTIHLACTGRIPRQLRQSFPTDRPLTGVFGKNFESINNLPIYRPINSGYDVDLDDTDPVPT